MNASTTAGDASAGFMDTRHWVEWGRSSKATGASKFHVHATRSHPAGSDAMNRSAFASKSRCSTASSSHTVMGDEPLAAAVHSARCDNAQPSAPGR